MNNLKELESGTNTLTGYDEANLFVKIKGTEGFVVIGNAIAAKLNLSKKGKVGWPVTFSYSTKPDEEDYLWLDKETFLEAGAGEFLTEVLEEAAQAKMDEEDTLESVTTRPQDIDRYFEVTSEYLDEGQVHSTQ